MNQVDQNINKDMIDSDLIDVESLQFSDDQTWLYTIPDDSGQHVDIVEWNITCDWPVKEDDDYVKTENELFSLLDNILKNEILAMPDKHKFDSRTYVKPKKRMQRPSIQSIVEAASNPPSMSPHQSLNQSPNKYLTYNKYSTTLGPISPMLRLKTFNVDTNTDNSTVVKEYAMKRRSLVQDDDPQLEDADATLVSEGSDRLSSEHLPTKPINIDLSQPAHNIHNTFNKGLTNIMNERGSLNMYQSGESLMRMSPPSLVSSLLMESSGNFNPESLEGRKSLPSHRDSGIPTSARDSIDPMMTSMTLSILDEKDMSTSFLSQTTYPDNDSLIDSLPPSLVSSVNSSYIVSNTSKPKDSLEPNIFSSATFTHLEQSERLLSARPRCQLYNSFTKRDSLRNSESYTKSREEGCQIETNKVLNENCDNKESPRTVQKMSPEMSETITLHYSNNKFKKDDAEKENLNSTFEKSDAFYKDMGMQPAGNLAKNSLNVTLDKQELNEIRQARQKLSLARRALPIDNDKPEDNSPIKTIQLPNQTITVPRQSMENASELLSRRRAMANNSFDKEEPPARETPKRNATFKKPSPPPKNSMDTTVVFVKADDAQMIDINSATLNLIDSSERTLQQEEWGLQERGMVGSSESTDTGTFSSSSPPESVPDAPPTMHPGSQIASTPLMSMKRGVKSDLMNLQNVISPIYDTTDDKSYIVHKSNDQYDMNTTVVNTATIVRKSAKREILSQPEKRSIGGLGGPAGLGGLGGLGGLAGSASRTLIGRAAPAANGNTGMAPPIAVPRRTGLPMSKLRQYSSHKELSRIPGGPVTAVGRAGGERMSMMRRNVYASNPALSPTAAAPAPSGPSGLVGPTPGSPSREIASRMEEPAPAPKPALVRQGTETLRRERPHNQQLVPPRDPPMVRPYATGAPQPRAPASRPTSVPVSRYHTAAPERPASSAAVAGGAGGAASTAGARPSRLPAPRRALRPPSVYSVAPTADVDHY